MIADPIKTVRVYLASDSDVYAATRRENLAQVYAGEILRDLVPVGQMPHACVVVQGSGGPQSRGYLPVSDQRVDVHCYGGSPEQAMGVFLAVQSAFNKLVDGRAVRAGGVGLLQTASLAGGVIQRREPDTKWPLAWSSWIVTVSHDVVESGV